MAKDTPIITGQILSSADITAWYREYPILPSKAEASFPLMASVNKTWKTVSNAETYMNEAADHISLNSSTPVGGREGFQNIIGEMTSFGKGYEMTADDIETFEGLKRDYAQFKNPTAAHNLLNFYGGDLEKIRIAMNAQMSYMDWDLISNACSYSMLRADSPYMVGLTAMDYPVSTWQKDDVAASWATASTEILADIQSAVDLGITKGKNYLDIFINKKWFGYVRSNTQIKAQTITLVGSLVSANVNPNLAAVNTMLGEYFDIPVRFVVVDELVTRSSLAGVRTTANPFQDGVAVFAQGPVLGHFEWNSIPIIDTREVYESFFTVGNYTQIDPTYSKIYGKGRAFPVIDTYADNFYLKINAEAWS